MTIASSLAPVASAIIPDEAGYRPTEWNPSNDPIFKHKQDPTSLAPISRPHALDFGYPEMKPQATTGIIENIAIMVDFNDTSGTKTKAYYTNLLFSNTTGSMDHYFLEASYNQTFMNGSVACTGWLRSAKNMTWWGADNSPGIDNKNGNIFELSREAMTLADSCINYSHYDKDGDKVLEPGEVNIMVIHAGKDQAASGVSTDIWSHRWVVGSGSTTLDGVRVTGWDTTGYVMMAEESPMGTFAHETAHYLGLPDLYDTDYSSRGVGDWCLMSGASWNGAPPGSKPGHPSAWAKIELGWLTPTVISGNVYGQKVPQFETNATAFKLTMSSQEYFLIVNIEKTGYDQPLPGSGILIWHIDEAMSSNNNENHKLVDVEEDGTGTQHLDTSFGSTGADDLWVNNMNGFSPSSKPNSTAYNGSNTNWAVTNISASGTNMTVDITRSSAWFQDAYLTIQDAGADGFLERVQASYNVDSNIANDNVKVQLLVFDYPGGFVYSNNDSYTTSFATVDYRTQSWTRPAGRGNHKVMLLLKDSGDAVVDSREFLNVWLENNNGGTNEWFKTASYTLKDLDADTAQEAISPSYDVDNGGGTTTVSVEIWLYNLNGTWAGNLTDGYSVTGTANDPRMNIDWSTPKTRTYNVYLRLNDSSGNVEQELYWPNILLGMLESCFASISLVAQNLDGHGTNDTAVMNYNVDTTGTTQDVGVKTEIWNASGLVRYIWDNFTVKGPGANSSDTREQRITVDVNETYDFHVYLYNATKLMDEFHRTGIFLEIRNFAPSYSGGLNNTWLLEDSAVWSIDLDDVFFDYEDDANLTFTTNRTEVTINATKVASWSPKGTDAELFDVTFTAYDAHNSSLNGTSPPIDLHIIYVNDPPVYNGNLADTNVPEDSTWRVNLRNQFYDEESQKFLQFTCNRPEITIQSDGNVSWSPKQGASSLIGVIFSTRDPFNASMTAQSPSINLNFVPVNDKPTYLGGLVNDTVLEDHEWVASLKAMWTDEEDPNNITFTSNYPQVIIDATGKAHWTPDNNATSLINLTFTAIDGKDATVTNSTPPITLTFQWLNDAPVYLGGLNDTEVPEDTVWMIDLMDYFMDEEYPNNLNFSCTNDKVLIDQVNDTATWAPVNGDYSLMEIIFVAMDAMEPSLKAQSNKINLVFVDVNDRPVYLGGLEGANVTGGTRWYIDLDDFFYDEENDQSIVFTCNYQEIEINPSTKWAIWEPVEGDQSLTGVTFTASDGNSNVTSDPIDLIFVPVVKPQPTPPTVTFTSPKEGDLLKGKVTVSGKALDLDGNVTKVEVRIDTYEWATATLADPVEDATSGGWSRQWTYIWDTVINTNGDHDISVKAKDNENLVSTTITVSMTVKNIIAPIPLLDIPTLEVETGQEVTMKATRSTGDIAGYFYDFGDGENSGWVDLDTVTHKYNSAGTFTVKLTLKDPEGKQSGTVSRTITVKTPYVPPPEDEEKNDNAGNGMMMGILIFIIIIVVVIALAAWVMRPSEKEKLMRMQHQREMAAKRRGNEADVRASGLYDGYEVEETEEMGDAYEGEGDYGSDSFTNDAPGNDGYGEEGAPDYGEYEERREYVPEHDDSEERGRRRH